jgi:hypothetical protein
MRLGIPKIHQQSIPQELGNMSLIALDDCRTCRLIGTNNFPVLFGVELAGEFGGVHEVTEHHRELTAFSFWCVMVGWWRFGSRVRCLDDRLL